MDVEYSIDRKAYETDSHTDNLIEITKKLKEIKSYRNDKIKKDLALKML